MKKAIKNLSILLLAGLVLAFVGCSDPEVTPVTPVTPAAEVSVEITSNVTQVIKGFNGGTITLTASVKNATDSTVTWSSSDTDVATVDSSGVVKAVGAGKTTITATASGKTASTEITVTEASVGDIIYTTDGGNTVELVASTSYDTTDDSITPVAVVTGYDTKGNVLGLGLKTSGKNLVWSTMNVNVFQNLDLEKIISTVTGSVGSYEITGDLDGSDNWDDLCEVETTYTTTLTNYPAFNFAVNYGTTTCGFDADSDLASGWYIPSIYELYTNIYLNKATLATVFQTENTDFSTATYWSSSQKEGTNNYDRAYAANFNTGDVAGYSKNGIPYVLVVRAF